jgi:calcineurin-like phosphoesterase family protein
MGDIFFTADTHFGHRNIITYANRPFASVEDMDEALVERWNERVRPDDRVYFLGDFSLRRGPVTGEILERLNGEIHVVWGNHDRPAYAIRERFASFHDYLQVRVGGQLIVCFHYAMRIWNQAHRGAWHLYGHSHGSLPDDPRARSMDVGVDCNDYYPFSFDEVAAHMEKKDYRPVDHHTPGRPD